MTPAEGDRLIVAALYEHRVLRSGQLAKRVQRSPPVIRRAIRERLEPEGLVQRLTGGAADQVAYCLSRAGLEYVAESRGQDLGSLPYSAKPPAGPSSLFFRHTVLTNDIWIAFQLACGNPGSPVRLAAAIPEWQLCADPRRRRSKPWDKFMLRERLPDLSDPQRFHTFRPDLLLLLQAAESPGSHVAAYFEADRGTESIADAIQAKIEGYFHWFVRQGFRQHGAEAMRVLFVVGAMQSTRRPLAMGQAVLEFCRVHQERHEAYRRAAFEAACRSRPDLDPQEMAGRFPPISLLTGCFRFCRAEDLMEANPLLDPIWLTAAGERVPFFRGRPPLAGHESLPLNP
jgi:hypothetical protein